MRYACTDCRKKFRTQGALEMHNNVKHPYAEVRTISLAQTADDADDVPHRSRAELIEIIDDIWHQLTVQPAAAKSIHRSHAIRAGLCGALLLLGLQAAVVGAAVKTQALGVTSKGELVLQPWVTTTTVAKR